MRVKQLKIAVIGAGPSGLCCAKHSLDYGHDVIVYEQCSRIGGQWAYTDHVGYDEFGIQIHSSMYKSVITNAPVDLMRFYDHPFPQLEPSFVSHEVILAYLQSYSDKFDLSRVIKFQHQVVNVRPLPGDRWQVFSKDLKNDILETRQFDAIFVCNGHYHKPNIPQFDGLDEFVGRKMHSHDYRRPDQLQNEIVLVIGGGTSSKDITIEIASQAKRVIWSNHSSLCNFMLPTNVKKVTDVKRFNISSVQMVNGDEEQISCVLFCTGYSNSFPFLSIDCGLTLKGRFHVEPLYKEMININHPTMALIGLSTCILTFLRHELQACVCLKYWSGEIPTRERMLKENKIQSEKHQNDGIDSRDNCATSVNYMSDYMDDLSEISQMKRVPPVFIKIFQDLHDLLVQKKTRRDFNYIILNDETFERKPISK